MKGGRSTWSWILWQDGSCNYDDQVRYIDLATELGYEYVLVDAWWNKNIGYERMEKLIDYAKSKDVGVFLWYNSGGYWNDIEQTPNGRMDNSIARKKEMEWMRDNRRRQQESFAQGKMQVEQLNIDEDSRDKKFMDQVMKVVRENYRNSYFEIGDFAELLGVSRSLLNKKLQNLTGQSAGQLLRTFRLNTARDLLLRNRTTRSMNISEIAYEVGFNDSKYFTRCFTKHFSVTPSSMLNDA